jgi:hypothetical protein
MIRFFVLIFLLYFKQLTAQKYFPDTLCGKDTVHVNEPARRHVQTKYYHENFKPYKYVICKSRSKFGVRNEIGLSNIYYNNNIGNWLGNKRSFYWGILLAYHNLNYGFSIRLNTFNPKTDLNFEGVTIPKNAVLNLVKFDYFVAYSVNFNNLISIEPYIGLNRTQFLLINSDEINLQFKFKEALGVSTGIKFNKYFEVKRYTYVSIYGTMGYTYADLKNIHPQFNNGFYEWNIGLAYKRYFIKRVIKIID